MGKKVLKGIAVLFALMLLIFALGPRPEYEDFSPHAYSGSFDLESVEAFIAERELQTPNLKPDNEARILWADSIASQTNYAIVYLPGFTATHFESGPLPEDLAKKYGMNLFHARIHAHGIQDVDIFKGVDPSQYLDSAREAIAIGKTLGKKLIIMGCSTGATYATYLAGNDPDVSALVFLSPNFEIFDPRTSLINGPWGKQILKATLNGSAYREVDYPERIGKYWTGRYHVDALIALQHLLESTMTEDVYKQIDQALFIGCYYKSEEEQDLIVSVEAMEKMFQSVSTPSALKKFEKFANVGHHIIACPEISKDYASVAKAVDDFFEDVILTNGRTD